MNGDGFLSMFEGKAHQCVNFFNLVIPHRETADGDAIAMHHDEISSATVRAVIGIRVANIHR